jgi:hypothetical protein
LILPLLQQVYDFSNTLLALHERLENLLGRRVDLVTDKSFTEREARLILPSVHYVMRPAPIELLRDIVPSRSGVPLGRGWPRRLPRWGLQGVNSWVHKELFKKFPDRHRHNLIGLMTGHLAPSEPGEDGRTIYPSRRSWMRFKKSEGRGCIGTVPEANGPKFSVMLIIVAWAGVAILVNLMLLNTHSGAGDQRDPSRQSNAAVAVPDPLRKLVGRWLRPDGGYVIQISSVHADGKLQAAYFNPRSVHVSQAQATLKDKEVRVFIELRDVGYPGATYTLVYEVEHDVLTGRYFQPTAGQSFDVIFVRMR